MAGELCSTGRRIGAHLVSILATVGALAALLPVAVPAAAAGPGTGDPHAGLPECRACHLEPKYLPAPKVLKENCARCHGDGLPLTPVAFGGPDRETLTVRPDPILAKDLATITKDMVFVPGGQFILGDNTRHRDEGPMQPWSVDAFYIDRTEVTNDAYHRFTEATGAPPPDHWQGPAPPPELGRHPVTYVSWYDARDYCAWRGKRLPTEFEWEKAARGTDGLKFPWGDIFDPSVANTPQSHIGHTTPVGSFPAGASPYGALDMAGNVWEWTESWYKPYPGNTRSNPNYGELYRVVRGGSWFDCEFYRCGISAPTFNRGFFIANTKNDTFGFRCAVSAPAGATAVSGRNPEPERKARP
jgi:formylglycine-generating enzyme required for sulfatase activity